jgi:ADP-heptose:LPS heptosyltransferase
MNLQRGSIRESVVRYEEEVYRVSLRSTFHLPDSIILGHIKGMIGIHAVAANRNADERMWNIGHWAELLRLLIAGGHDIKFIGAWEDRPYYSRLFYLLSEEEQTHIFDMVGIKTLECIPWEIWKCSVLVCVNSAIMHIAVEFSPFTPIVAIVGGTPARIVLPPDKDNLRILEDPELKWWDEHAEHGPRVSRLNEIMPEQVLEKINEIV